MEQTTTTPLWIILTQEKKARTLTIPRAWGLQEAAALAEELWEKEGRALDVQLMRGAAVCVCRFPPE